MLSPEDLLRKKRELAEKFKGTPLEHFYAETTRSLCDNCPANDTCDAAFDAYNAIPDGAGPDYSDYCLMEK